jgi:hypothetical protein
MGGHNLFCKPCELMRNETIRRTVLSFRPEFKYCPYCGKMINRSDLYFGINNDLIQLF